MTKGALNGSLKLVATLGTKAQFALTGSDVYNASAGITGKLEQAIDIKDWLITVTADPFKVSMPPPPIKLGALTGALDFFWTDLKGNQQTQTFIST